MIIVGECEKLADGSYSIKREFYRQGYVFKDEYAYQNFPDKPCYVPENSGNVYTANDILKLCDNNKEIADDIFDLLDWQHPESQLEDLISNGEYDRCQHCGHLFATHTDKGYPVHNCPICKNVYYYSNIG